MNASNGRVGGRKARDKRKGKRKESVRRRPGGNMNRPGAESAPETAMGKAKEWLAALLAKGGKTAGGIRPRKG